MATVQGGPGDIGLCHNFAGATWPIANTLTGFNIGPFQVTGSFDETDSGIVPLSKAGGWARLTGTNEDGYGIAVGTNVGFSPVLNGPMWIEARVESQVLTARNIFIGFASANAEDVVEPLTATTLTLTPVAASYAGFMFDSQLNVSDFWYMPHNGGTTTGETTAADVVTDAIVAAATDIVRVEIDPNGTARWWLNGKLKQTLEGAVSTTTLLAGFAGVFGTAATITDLDINYLDFSAYRDWTV